MVGPHIAMIAVFCSILLQKLVVKIRKHKVVVGSSRGDVPKYVREGVALHGTHSTLGVPWPQLSYSTAIFRQFLVDMLQIFQCYIFKGCCDIMYALH